MMGLGRRGGGGRRIMDLDSKGWAAREGGLAWGCCNAGGQA